VKRGLIIGLVAAGLVVVLLWWFALYSPTTKDLSDTQAKTEEARHAQDSLEATLRRLQGLAKSAPQQQAILRRLNAAVPETPDLANFIIQANQIATDSGIDFLSIAPSPPAAGTSGGTTTTINLNIQIKGGFFQVLEYLNRLEDLDRLVVVDTINLTAGSGGSTGSSSSSSASSGATTDTGSLSVTLTGRMFTRAPAAAAPGGATTPTTPGAPGTTTPTTPASGGSTGSSTTTTVAPGTGNS
jgi:Tfp pilus assembly protein PilO